MDRLALRQCAPAAVVVRSNGQIVRRYGALKRFITGPTGRTALDVVALARDALKPTLRAVLHEAVRRRRTVVATTDLGRARPRTAVRITVKPLKARPRTEHLWTISFENLVAPPRVTSRSSGRGEVGLVRRLKAQLRATQRHHQRLFVELGHRSEALQAASQEILSMREELRSSNNEIGTSREEMQVMNEELMTLNDQLHDNVQEVTATNADLANLLASTDIATVLLDPGLRIKRFTAAAAQVLNLTASDTGRPLGQIASTAINASLLHDARRVLQTSTPLEKALVADDGRHYFLRVLPYRTAGNPAQGVVLTLVDVTTLTHAERALRVARQQAAEDLRRMTRLHELSAQTVGPGDVSSMLDNVVHAAVDMTVAEMADIQRVDGDGVLTIAAHAGFERHFLDFFARVDTHTDSPCSAAAMTRQRVVIEDVAAIPGPTDRPALQELAAAGVRAVQSTPLFDRSGDLLGVFSTHYRQVHRFDDGELRWLDLLARHAGDVIERQRADERLARSYQELEARVADRTRWLSLMHDVALAINEAATWDDALHRVLRRLCETEHWQIGFIYLPQSGSPDAIAPVISCYGDERFRPFCELSMRQTYRRGERLPGRVYADQQPFWAVDVESLLAAIPIRAITATRAGLRAGVALPVTIRADVVAVLEIFSDREHPPSEQLTTLMHNLGEQIGRVLEREQATARMADMVWREQQELLHTLHDSLGQTLTGLGMLSSGLRQRLASDPEAAGTAAEIVRQTQLALDQVRQLAKNLFPVEVEAESLAAALRALASATRSLHKIDVLVEDQAPRGLRDGKVATELYRIAQEAVTNSVKHSAAKTVRIRLDGAGGRTRLIVADDGVGIAHPEPGSGAGLRIMQYRANSIGASLTVERGAEGGTVVTCALRQPLASAPAQA